MIRRTRAVVLTAVVLAASLPLTACAASPSSSPTPTASEAAPASTPAETPAAVDGEVASVLVRADALEYLDSSDQPVDGARDAYTEPIDAALTRLTEMLGDPTAEVYESQFTAGTGTLHRWNGLALDAFPAEMVADVPDAPLWGVRLESESTDDLALVTVDGLGVGDQVPADLETSACGGLMAEIVGTLGVQVDVDGTESAVAAIRSPVYTDACE